MTETVDEHETTAVERMLFFSDAVIAIAITLLAIEIKLPAKIDDGHGASLAAELLTLVPRVIGFIISFVLIGQTWIEHHRLGRLLRRVPRSLLRWNLLLLFFIVLMPFATAVVSEHSDGPSSGLAVMLYAAIFGGQGIAKAGLWFEALRSKALASPLTADERGIGFTLWAAPIAALGVATAASLGVASAMWGFLAVPVTAYLLRIASERLLVDRARPA